MFFVCILILADFDSLRLGRRNHLKTNVHHPHQTEHYNCKTNTQKSAPDNGQTPQCTLHFTPCIAVYKWHSFTGFTELYSYIRSLEFLGVLQQRELCACSYWGFKKFHALASKIEEMPQISWKLTCSQVTISGPSGDTFHKELLVWIRLILIIALFFWVTEFISRLWNMDKLKCIGPGSYYTGERVELTPSHQIYTYST